MIMKKLRVGTYLGKYRIDGRLGDGGYATVYRATDTLLGMKVALKLPAPELIAAGLLDEFKREARTAMQLEHPNILPVRDASMIEDRFVIITPLGERTLDERLKKRISFEVAFDAITQLLGGVAHAHENGVIHCDIKPENVILFPNNQLRLADFGIAKATRRTISASGAGTIGYMAPEQAMGKPSTRSDVFSLGLIAYRTFSSHWPVYPFDWPPPGVNNLRRRAHPELVDVIRKSIEVTPRKRFRDAGRMLAAWNQTRLKAFRFARRHRVSTR